MPKSPSHILLTTRRWMMLLAAALLAAACARSPEAQKARHLERGDRYVQREQYREAIIEYRNVLRLDQNNGHAMRQIAEPVVSEPELAQGMAVVRVQPQHIAVLDDGVAVLFPLYIPVPALQMPRLLRFRRLGTRRRQKSRR